jgi:hypothetical protein
MRESHHQEREKHGRSVREREEITVKERKRAKADRRLF